METTLANHVEISRGCFAAETSISYEVHEPENNDHQNTPKAVDVQPSSQHSNNHEFTLELPRDILTAYIVIRLNGTWKRLTPISKACILFGLIFSFSVQFTVFASFIHSSVMGFIDGFVVSTTGEDLWYNLVAISSLFMYLWKDVMAYYHSVWFYLNIEEKQHHSGFHLSARRLTKEAMEKGITKTFKKDKATELIAFGQFRVFLIAMFVLYIGFALYSLVAIAASSHEGLADELSVAINIFFVLEIDDWACELFVIGPGVLRDYQFDIDVVVPMDNEEEQGATKSVERKLKITTTFLMVSVASCYAMSYYHIAFKDDNDGHF